MKVILNSLLTLVFLCIISCANRNDQANVYVHEEIVLFQLINKRLEVAPLVAKSKWNTKVPIDDNAREKIILDNVENQANEMAIDKQFARDFFKAQFEAGKLVQRQLHKQWQLQNQPPFEPSPNLTAEVRPILDQLTPRLLKELSKIKPNSCSPTHLKDLKNDARKAISPTFDDQVVETALKPIIDYCTRGNK